MCAMRMNCISHSSIKLSKNFNSSSERMIKEMVFMFAFSLFCCHDIRSLITGKHRFHSNLKLNRLLNILGVHWTNRTSEVKRNGKDDNPLDYSFFSSIFQMGHGSKSLIQFIGETNISFLNVSPSFELWPIFRFNHCHINAWTRWMTRIIQQLNRFHYLLGSWSLFSKGYILILI